MNPVRYLQVNNVRSAVYAVGVGNEAAVFVHGNPGPMEDWTEVAEGARQVCRVVAFDMPGYGRADHPRDFDFTISGYARHLAGLVDQLGLRRVHLVLHDFGAAWGARWAAEHPSALASITLINPLPLLHEFRWHQFARLWQTPLLGELLQATSGARSIRYVMNRDNPTAFPDAFIERILHYKDRNQLRAVLKLYRATKAVAQLGELGACLKALDPPACIIWGASDNYAPRKHAQPMSQLFTDVELHELAGLGHWPFVDAPATVTSIVRSFLERQTVANPPNV